MPSERLLVWGGGGHGRVVAEVARLAGFEVAGFADGDPAKLGRIVEPGGAAVLLTESDLLAAIADRRALPFECGAVALALGDNRLRHRALELLVGISLPPLVHPAAVVSTGATIGPATVVCARAVINPGAVVGAGVIVNTGAIVEHDCEVADGAHVSPGAILAGGVKVGARSWVGAGATVIGGIRIGHEAVVGAGAVAIRDVPDGEKVVGVPARPLASARGAADHRKESDRVGPDPDRGTLTLNST